MKQWESLKFILKPRFWLMNERYNETLDRIINKAIDENQIVIVDNYHCRIKHLHIWIENYPYSFGTYCRHRPSRLTIERLMRHLCKIGRIPREQRITNEMLELAGQL